jgi:hypothetical protein
MKIVCPSCRVPVAADGVDLATGLASCRGCGNVFRFDTAPELAAAPARARPRVEQPANVAVSEAGGELTIQYRWFSLKHVIMAFVCLLWDGFLVRWYSETLAAGDVIMSLIPVFHVAVGLAITYSTLAGLVNTSTLRIDGQRLSVHHHPLPWRGNTELAAHDVMQLYCEPKRSRARGLYTYALGALLRDGRRTILLSGISSADLPLFLEERAERWMKIVDQPVAGELASE